MCQSRWRSPSLANDSLPIIDNQPPRTSAATFASSSIFCLLFPAKCLDFATHNHAYSIDSGA